jgi:hypothetical protein
MYRFLSNFYPSPMRAFDEVLQQEVFVPSVEHGYQADETLQHLWRKAMLIGTQDASGTVVVPTAAEVNKLGQQVELRADWDDAFKVKCMMRWLLIVLYTAVTGTAPLGFGSLVTADRTREGLGMPRTFASQSWPWDPISSWIRAPGETRDSFYGGSP